MKTLLLILTSLSSALSKPALLENHIHGFETTLSLPAFTSAKNAPASKIQEHRAVHDNRAEENIYANEEIMNSPKDENIRHESETSKEMGDRMKFRVYRNSGDEDTFNDSREKCKKQVQLKFCEDGSDITSQMRQENTIGNVRVMTKDGMEERIKMVKEALEHIKKYLHVDNNSKIKSLDSKEEIETEQSQLDEYEVYHALVNNLGNFHSMSLDSVPKIDRKLNDTKPQQSRLTTSGDDSRIKQIEYDFEVISKFLDDYITKPSGSNEESKNETKLAESRMDQWMHNIDKIQNGVATGINIEDRFRSEKYNDHLMHSLQSTAFSNNHEVHNEEIFKNNEEEHPEIVMTQDINSKSNLHSDSLRLEAEATLVPETSDLISKTDLTATEQHDVPKYNDLESEYFENKHEFGRVEHVKDMISKEDNSEDTIKNKLHEQAEIKAGSSVRNDAENVAQNFKSMTDLDNESSNSDDNYLRPNLQNEASEQQNKIETRKSDTTTNRLITENNDFNEMHNFEHRNLRPLQTSEERNNQKSNENVPDQERAPLLAEESFNTMQSLTSTSVNNSPLIITPPREATSDLENIQHLPPPSKKNDDTNPANEFDEVSNTPRRLTNTNNVHHMKTLEDNKNEAKQELFHERNQNVITAKQANELGNINDPLLQKLNGHVNTQWAQMRDTDMVMPQTLPNVNIKQNVMAPGAHSDGSKMERYDRIYEQNDLNGKENIQWIQKSSAQNSGIKTFGDQFLHMPAFRASHPNLNFKNSETNLLRFSDSRLTSDRFANDATNLRDNSFSSVMVPVHRDRMDNEDNMVQASEHMRQLMQKSGTDYAQSWYNRHGMARGSSYNQEQVNVPASAGSGAVGLFPNANTAGCAIPLLVSCSPSVVSGTLAKGQPSYNTHSYGSTDTYKYHKKRETKKNYDADVNKITQMKMLKKVVEPAANKVELLKSSNL